MAIIIIVSLCLILMIMYFFYNLIKNKKKSSVKVKNKQKKPKKRKQETTVKNVHLTLQETFMIRKELLFWKYLNYILPKKFIAIPKISLNTLVVPDGDKTIFNLISDKFLDFVVFLEQTMHPVLVIDIYDKSFNDEKLDEQDPFLVEVLSKLNLKVIHILVSNNFDREKTKSEIFEALNILNDLNN